MVVVSQPTDTIGRPSKPEWADFVHTGPGTLAGRYLRMFWQPVALSADLPAGRTIPIRIMSEDLTLYRGEGGGAHLLAFRCAHRGTQLSTGWVEGDASTMAGSTMRQANASSSRLSRSLSASVSASAPTRLRSTSG
ncbi:MAG: hypothetical protein HW416_3094 [Chloroflexi bacterium]|nr:hypothetical protein [Chloroflexota bacterium]